MTSHIQVSLRIHDPSNYPQWSITMGCLGEDLPVRTNELLLDCKLLALSHQAEEHQVIT